MSAVIGGVLVGVAITVGYYTAVAWRDRRRASKRRQLFLEADDKLFTEPWVLPPVNTSVAPDGQARAGDES